MDVSDEEAQAAKDTLEAAIKEYHRAIDPDVFIDAWTLVSHKRTVELEAENSSMVGHLEPTGQAWPMTVGILRIASNAAEFGGEDDDDD